MNPPRLIVGLGNPGPEYETTRHNVGFWFVDHLADKLKVTLAPQAKFFGKAGRAGETWLLEPTTFMNRSGQSVAALASQLGREVRQAEMPWRRGLHREGIRRSAPELPDEEIERLTDMKKRGMTYAIHNFAESAYDRSGVELFEREVIPALA